MANPTWSGYVPLVGINVASVAPLQILSPSFGRLANSTIYLSGPVGNGFVALHLTTADIDLGLQVIQSKRALGLTLAS